MDQAESATENYKGVWGNRIGFGARPALIMVDFLQAYTTPGAPLFAEGVVSAVAASVSLLSTARARGVPVIHTNIRYHPGTFADGGVWVRKAPVMRAMTAGNPLAEFCEAVAPASDEMVVTKQYASAFFGTSLASMLHADGIDTVVLAGCSTSGCIRASAVDAVQHGFRTIVVRDCVGDRHQGPHEANLFDIDSKYGDVMAKDEVMKHFASLSVTRPPQRT